MLISLPKYIQAHETEKQFVLNTKANVSIKLLFYYLYKWAFTAWESQASQLYVWVALET